MKSSRRSSIIILIALSFGALTAALYSQLVLGAVPCAWCILQRIAFLALLFFGLIALVFDLFSKQIASRLVTFLGALASMFGVWAGYNQIESVRRMNDCGISLANKWLLDLSLDDFSRTFFQVKANCSDASFPIFGIPMEAFSVVGFFTAFALCIAATAKK